MAELSTNRLLRFAKELLPATGFGELLTVARDEVRATAGYQHVWFMVADRDDLSELRMIALPDGQREVALEGAAPLKVKGDKLLEALIASEGPVVIEDARTDPRTSQQVFERLPDRTLVTIPLRLLDKPLGLFGVGTSGEEGCRAPNLVELDYLVGMASQIAVAAGRIRSVEALKRAAAERLELERRQLQAQKLESLGLLAGGIAHDFNNLLTVIISSASMAERVVGDRALPVEVQGDLRAILEAAGRAQALTHKLLAVSRQQDLDLRPTDLNVRLTELLALLRRIFPETVEIDFIKGARLPPIEGDASQLDQVFMNLCINARDAMANGGRLTLETEQVVVKDGYAETHPWAKPGRYVLSTVTDTGVGMSRDLVDRIFDPFFTTKGQAGTGLGLSISYGIVRQHGGMLHCYSEPGIGTSFKVYLPVLERPVVSAGAKLTGTSPRGGINERILVAEDDAGVRAVALRVLRHAGYDVTGAETGDAACALAAGQAFDLVLLDVVMPGSPCPEVVKRLRVVSPESRILLSSGYTAGTNVIELLRETGLELLRKPYDPDQLLFRVRRTIDGGVAAHRTG